MDAVVNLHCLGSINSILPGPAPRDALRSRCQPRYYPTSTDVHSATAMEEIRGQSYLQEFHPALFAVEVSCYTFPNLLLREYVRVLRVWRPWSPPFRKFSGLTDQYDPFQ